MYILKKKQEFHNSVQNNNSKDCDDCIGKKMLSTSGSKPSHLENKSPYVPDKHNISTHNARLWLHYM